MKKIIVILIIIVLIGGGLYLVAHKSLVKQLIGQSTQPSPAASQSMAGQQSGTTQQYPRPSGGFGGRQFGNMPQGSTPIFGQVSAVSGNQLTIQRKSRNGNGTTITVDLTSSTQYSGGSQSDIQTGTRIGGYGTANSDGSINAQQIMINPSFGNRGGNQNTQQ